ncbi:hypothetical protein SEA_LONEWOLF_38 [Mycobacterium phage LoneWolf]|nr:hypothetical protein SEA_LONEWOLF_38 [Mycobacterium phage LoneWolf]
MLTWIRRLFKRNPDRYPEWRPDQILTPENRAITRPEYFRTEYDRLPPVLQPRGFIDLQLDAIADWHKRQEAWEESLLLDGWTEAGVDEHGNKVFTKHCVPGSRP